MRTVVAIPSQYGSQLYQVERLKVIRVQRSTRECYQRVIKKDRTRKRSFDNVISLTIAVLLFVHASRKGMPMTSVFSLENHS